MTFAELATRATITVPEAGEVLGIERKTVYEAIRRGQIPALHLGRRVLIPVPQLLALLNGSDGEA